jgi:hypothetical protein
LGQAATQAPQPTQAEASSDLSAASLLIGTLLASGALPVLAEMKPPAWMILYHREGGRAPGLDPDLIAILEAAHVQLTGSDPLVRTMRRAVDDDPAAATDALTAIMLESDRFLPLRYEPFVDDIQHPEEGGVGADLLGLVLDEAALGGRSGLAPDVKSEVHYL